MYTMPTIITEAYSILLFMYNYFTASKMKAMAYTVILSLVSMTYFSSKAKPTNDINYRCNTYKSYRT